jgi:hypothetical protein
VKTKVGILAAVANEIRSLKVLYIEIEIVMLYFNALLLSMVCLKFQL